MREGISKKSLAANSRLASLSSKPIRAATGRGYRRASFWTASSMRGSPRPVTTSWPPCATMVSAASSDRSMPFWCTRREMIEKRGPRESGSSKVRRISAALRRFHCRMIWSPERPPSISGLPRLSGPASI